jgi:hypothetical protein
MKPSRRCITVLGALGSLTIFASVPVHAQDEIAPAADNAPATVRGCVVDVDGAGVPEAKITLTNISSLEHYALASAENGEFAFGNVPSAAYLITVEAKGFEPYRSAEFAMSPGQGL